MKNLTDEIKKANAIFNLKIKISKIKL